MPTIQEMADMAVRYCTSMADAMIVACIQRHYRTGEPLSVRERLRERLEGRAPRSSAPPRLVYAEPEDEDWERLMRENSDTRWVHC